VFTGLIEEVGTIRSAIPHGDGIRFEISARTVLDDLAIDDSVSVNGVCLTATQVTDASFFVTAVHETLSKTSLGSLRDGASINLERAVRVHDRLGGHIVQGHVDCIGRIDSISALQTGWEVWISFPAAFARYIIPVGSICVNGISLTVARIDDTRSVVDEARCMVALIPHTIEHTTMRDAREGDVVNLEFDVLAKYVERLLHR
jgi:riboflavin synthase